MTYLLKSILFQGQCFAGQGPPAGLQLWLGNEETDRFTDTSVMSNYGYFQLQADVGVWTVKIAPGKNLFLHQNFLKDSHFVYSKYSSGVLF